MKKLLTILLVLSSLKIYAQTDTVVVKDYAQVLITIGKSGSVEPVTNFSNLTKAGFFMYGIPEGELKLCNDEELFVWVNGKLLETITGCHHFSSQQLFEKAENDTIYVSVSTSKFQNFLCEQVVFETLTIVREEVSRPRAVQEISQQFNTIVIIFLLATFAIFSASFPSRLAFFLSRTFSLKTSYYQFINTNFFERANISLIAISSLTIGFELIYIDQKINLTFLDAPTNLTESFIQWATLSAYVFVFYIAKRIIVQLISGMFRMRRLRDWQLFDLANFGGYFILVLFIIILWDFVLKSAPDTWIKPYFAQYFVVVIILFQLWLVIKFVINSSYQKLLIISYLCATEIIPAILITGWIFK